MRFRKLAASTALILALGGAVGVLYGNETAEAAGCSLTAHVPTNSKKVIYSKASSNCRGTITATVSWSRPGPDSSLVSNTAYGTSVTAGETCKWSVAKDRNIYTTAKRGANYGESRTVSFTSSKSGTCKK